VLAAGLLAEWLLAARLSGRDPLMDVFATATTADFECDCAGPGSCVICAPVTRGRY